MKIDKSEVSRIKGDCNEAKSRLIEVMDELLSIGAEKEAKQLEQIIIRLEIWQNK